MIGESHRRGVAERGTLTGTGLPRGLHERLVWWVAAALRERVARRGGAISSPRSIARIAEAALRNLAAHDDGDRLEAAAMRLAEAVDAQAGELPALIDEIAARPPAGGACRVPGACAGRDATNWRAS